jgi:predicted glycosyltransferase
MKIFIDIGHPAHVHYFKNFCREMRSRGHYITITARDKECAHELLDIYGFNYINRGPGAGSLAGKIAYLFKADYMLYKYAKEADPDLFLSFCSPYAAQVSTLLGKPHIAFDDTEHAKLGQLMYVPFTDAICTPYIFDKDFGEKQIRFNGFMELCALHPKRFKPNPSILEALDLKKEEKYVILRFVSWNASHDVGERGIPDHKKEELARKLSNYARVFISSEDPLPANLQAYKINIPPDRIHDALYYADLFVGEGATMASESVLLGTPAIYISSIETAFHKMLAEKGLLYDFRNFPGVQEKAVELISNDKIENKHKQKLQAFLADKIDVTAFMVWFVEHYPKSKQQLQNGSKIGIGDFM